MPSGCLRSAVWHDFGRNCLPAGLWRIQHDYVESRHSCRRLHDYRECRLRVDPALNSTDTDGQLKIMKSHFSSRPYTLGLALAILLFSPRAVSAEPYAIAVPPPTGSYKVGTSSMRIVDPRRSDPYVKASNRELLIQLWYPASVVQGYHLADYASPKVWRYISHLTGVDLPPIQTNSRVDAPMAPGPRPIVLLTHGYTGTLTDYTFLAEDLASRGYVVVSIAHTYESTAVEFPDGRLVLSMLGSHFRVDALRTDEKTISFAAHVRVQDLSSVLDELQRLNATRNSFLNGQLDLRRVAVMGHSLGGIAALGSLSGDPRISAAVVLDAPAYATSVRGSDKPVLILAAGRDQWGARDCQLWRNLRGPRLLVDLRGAEHLTASDAVWLAKDFPQLEAQTGAMGTEKTMTAMRNYIVGFLDYVLLGKAKSPFLLAPSPDYPDVALTTEKQALCGELVTNGLRSAK
jgi:predicted dienelactone hydrolase